MVQTATVAFAADGGGKQFSKRLNGLGFLGDGGGHTLLYCEWPWYNEKQFNMEHLHFTTTATLSDDAFLDHVQRLEDDGHEEGSPQHLDTIRALLRQSPGTLHVFEEHSHLLGTLLHHTSEQALTQMDRRDPALLGAYATMLMQYPMDDFMAETASYYCRNAWERITKPLYTALKLTMGYLSTSTGLAHAHPVLYTAVEQGLLNPDALLDHLLGNAKAQIVESKGDDLPDEAFDMHSIVEETPFGALLVALRPLVLDLQWRPLSDEGYQYLWLVHNGLSLFDNDHSEPREVAFLQTLLQYRPEKLHHALVFLSRENFGVRTALVDAFFPLPLSVCEAGPVLQHLVTIVGGVGADVFDKKAQDVMAAIEQCHPELAELIALHRQLYNEFTQENAPVLVGAFERLRGKVGAEMSVDTSVFSEAPNV